MISEQIYTTERNIVQEIKKIIDRKWDSLRMFDYIKIQVRIRNTSRIKSNDIIEFTYKCYEFRMYDKTCLTRLKKYEYG